MPNSVPTKASAWRGVEEEVGRSSNIVWNCLLEDFYDWLSLSLSHGFFIRMLDHRRSLTCQFSDLGERIILAWELPPPCSVSSIWLTPPVSFCQCLLTWPAGPLDQNCGQSYTNSHSLLAYIGSRKTIRHLLLHKPWAWGLYRSIPHSVNASNQSQPHWSIFP